MKALVWKCREPKSVMIWLRYSLNLFIDLNDGDKSLVVADKTLISIAKRNMEGIYPLYYEMGKAGAKEINSKNIYESLITAFKYGNIGKYSNKLTVLWNSEKPNMTTIKQITALNNFSIDAAKTLLMPTPPEDVIEHMKEASKKLPYFFQFAKGKESTQVAKINGSTVNRICRNIENIKQNKYDFSQVGNFRSNMLIRNRAIEINDKIIKEYKRLDKEKNKYFFKSDTLEKEEIAAAVYNMLQYEFSLICEREGVTYEDAVDMITKYIYKTNRNCKKSFLFNVFGDVIVETLKQNIEKSYSNTVQCVRCGKRIKKKNNSVKYCDKCAKGIKLEQTRELARKSMKNLREERMLRKQKT